MRREIARMRDQVASEASRLDLPVTVMHVTRRAAGRADRWASPPTPRAAVAYLTTDDIDHAAAQIVHDWVDAQTAVGRTVTGGERAALDRAATLRNPTPNPVTTLGGTR